ncbi:MAG TPA: carboxypeptidase-like regulatory domain-containing protein, partial [Hanamia sp.]|nr:carboxypeptidase-like regulatory domain-containing protein [Hanamia sp.]
MKRKTIRLLLCLFLAMCSTLAFSQENKTITGYVKDNSGDPIPGASIKIMGTKKGVASDATGKFSIKAASSDKLQITSVGYEPTEVSVGGQSNLMIVMNATNSSLEGVVVTALGQKQQKRSLGYATTTITANEIIKTAPTNFASALYGKAPGVRIATAPGGSTSGVAIQIRGINSITGRTQPLIVMDGVPIHDGSFNNGNYWSDQRLRGNGLIDLNPDDIESIT